MWRQSSGQVVAVATGAAAGGGADAGGEPGNGGGATVGGGGFEAGGEGEVWVVGGRGEVPGTELGEGKLRVRDDRQVIEGYGKQG